MIKSLICSTRGVVLGVAESNSTRGKWSGQTRCPIRHPAKPDLPTETPLTPAMTACLARSGPLYPSHLRRQTWTEQCCNGQPEASGRFHHLINAYTHPYNCDCNALKPLILASFPRRADEFAHELMSQNLAFAPRIEPARRAHLTPCVVHSRVSHQQSLCLIRGLAWPT